MKNLQIVKCSKEDPSGHTPFATVSGKFILLSLWIQSSLFIVIRRSLTYFLYSIFCLNLNGQGRWRPESSSKYTWVLEASRLPEVRAQKLKPPETTAANLIGCQTCQRLLAAKRRSPPRVVAQQRRQSCYWPGGPLKAKIKSTGCAQLAQLEGCQGCLEPQVALVFKGRAPNLYRSGC